MKTFVFKVETTNFLDVAVTVGANETQQDAEKVLERRIGEVAGCFPDRYVVNDVREEDDKTF